jgi:hypothetical protein
MEAICSSETSVVTQRTTRRHIPEDDTLHNHSCGNLKSYLVKTSSSYCCCLLLLFLRFRTMNEKKKYSAEIK